MTRAAVTEKTKTPTASPNVRHTMGSSRNRFSRGDKLEKAHCTTRNSSEKMMLTSPRTPKPTPISVSVTRLLATVGQADIRGSSSPSPRPATANSNCTRPARSRRRGRSNRPSRRAASPSITTREPFLGTAAGPRWPRDTRVLAAARDDELVLNMLRTLPVLRTLQQQSKDTCAGGRHPPWVR